MKIMGILNVTPDSFSDGGSHYELEQALKQAERMLEEGVDILDIGGESTRPFADPVSIEEELNRVVPVIEKIRQNHNIPISIDTMKADVARRALDAGADILNDVSALRHDPEMEKLVQQTDVPVVIMHMQGTPRNMQVNPEYGDVVEEVREFFVERLDHLKKLGVDLSRIILDPGIGFGKKLEHNLSLLKHMEAFSKLGQRVLLGHSRKRFIGDITGKEVEDRDLPTAVISALALSQHVDIVRVHNVAASRDAIAIRQAILEAK